MSSPERRVDPSLFHLMVQQVKDYALFLLDPTGHIATWNLGAQRIKGYLPEEIIGRHFSTFYPPEAVASGWPAHELKVAGEEGRFEDEGWRVRKDGSRFWASVVITALRDDDGTLLGFSKITRDLTERRMHEEALRQSEERFRLLVEGVVDYAVYMLDPEGIVTSWNAGAERIEGYARDEVLGRHFSRFHTQEDFDAGKPWESLATAQRTGMAEDTGWRVKKGGERFWARTVIRPLYDTEGQLRGFAHVTQDVSNQRHIQDLEKASRNLHEFIAMLAHELRNPLAPIRAAVQVMGKIPADDPAQENMRQTIERQSAQLVHIVDDMVDISRISRGVLKIERLPVSVLEVVNRALETSSPQIEARLHTLSVELPGEPLRIDGDVHRLSQLLSNLLNNAALYTPEGGRIELSARKDGGQVAISVRDSGRGIEPEMIERIFDMFVQGRSPMQRVGGGLGIGLALARKLAELHNGTLEAYSEGTGKGAEFVVRLPLKEETAEAAAQAPVASSPAIARRVLVVDDNTDAADTLDLLLRSLGHTTRVANNGQDALALAAGFRPDVILLDIGMPGLDGYEVARRLEDLRKVYPFRIIAVTGWGQDADRKRAREAGFDFHLLKPVDINLLAQVLGGRNGSALH
jgi:PAS domain S-box-containing protein